MDSVGGRLGASDDFGRGQVSGPSGFGGSDPGTAMGSPSGSARAVKAPVAWLVVALLSLLVSAALILPWSGWTSAVGYVLAGLVTAFVVSVYRAKDQMAKRDPYYVGGQFLGMRADMATRVLLLACWLLSLPHVWVVATAVGRL